MNPCENLVAAEVSLTLSWSGVDRISLRGERMYEGQVYWDTRRVAEQVAEVRTAVAAS